MDPDPTPGSIPRFMAQTCTTQTPASLPLPLLPTCSKKLLLPSLGGSQCAGRAPDAVLELCSPAEVFVSQSSCAYPQAMLTQSGLLTFPYTVDEGLDPESPHRSLAMSPWLHVTPDLSMCSQQPTGSTMAGAGAWRTAQRRQTEENRASRRM